MSSPRSLFILAALAVAYLIAGNLSRPADAQQAELLGNKRCVGIATATLRRENPVVTRVYRIFDDGTVETYDDGAPDAKWRALGE